MHCKECGKKCHDNAVACTSCGTNPRLGRNFCNACGVKTKDNQVVCLKCGVSLGASGPRQTTRSARQTAGYGHVNNHMVKAFLVTVLCCLPLGIVAIIKSSEVNGKLAAGDVQGAQLAAAEADKWANYGLIGCIIFVVLYIMLVVVAGVAIGM